MFTKNTLRTAALLPREGSKLSPIKASALPQFLGSPGWVKTDKHNSLRQRSVWALWNQESWLHAGNVGCHVTQDQLHAGERGGTGRVGELQSFPTVLQHPFPWLGIYLVAVSLDKVDSDRFCPVFSGLLYGNEPLEVTTPPFLPVSWKHLLNVIFSWK